MEATALLGRTKIAGPKGVTYLVDDFACQVRGGVLQPGTDASDARWVGVDQLRELGCTPRLVETLKEWGALG